MNQQLPEIFAIVRQAYRGPCLQILTSHTTNDGVSYIRRQRPYDRYAFYVDNFRNVEEFDELALHGTSYGDTRAPTTIYTFRIMQPDGETAAEIKGWYLPYYFRYRGLHVPVMDFQMRAWIPGDYTPVPIRANLNEFLARMEEIQRDRMQEIQLREDEQASSPYRYRSNSPNEIDDYRYFQNRIAAGGGRPRTRAGLIPPPAPVIEYRERVVEVPVERVVERVVVQTRALPLPKDIGDILLSQARKGSDSCPIAAIPYAECESLSVSSCFHIFDKASLTRWQESHTTCPVCRCKIENIVSDTRIDAVSTV